MAVEILVLGRNERLDHFRRHGIDGNEGAVLTGIFGDQRAVSGVHAAHHRRLVIGQLRIVRQIVRNADHIDSGRGQHHQPQDDRGDPADQTNAQKNFRYAHIPLRKRMSPHFEAIIRSRAVN